MPETGLTVLLLLLLLLPSSAEDATQSVTLGSQSIMEASSSLPLLPVQF